MTETAEDIHTSVRERFGRLARDPASETRLPIGAASARRLGYDPREIDALPAACTARFAGVGCPLALGPVPAGGTVLDLGSGSGVDAFLAARRVGPRGKVVGLDVTPEMVEVAAAFATELGLGQVRFHLGSAESLPLAAASVDVAISNGVVNLCPDKDQVVAELYRVLRPGGRLYVADVTLEEGVDQATVEKFGTWSNWICGAIPGRSFLEMLTKAGFSRTRFIARTGYRTSPYTSGATFVASKPGR